MREKLIELICKADKEDYESRTQDEHYVFMADLLIANGVTIPVRCEDCKQEQKCLMCIGIIGDTPLTTSSRHIDFCSYGERKDNG